MQTAQLPQLLGWQHSQHVQRSRQKAAGGIEAELARMGQQLPPANAANSHRRLSYALRGWTA